MQSTARTCPPSAKALLAVLGLALVASLPVAAKQSDRQQPANVDSKSFDGSQQPNGKVIWTGSVVITQGTLKITGDKATGFLDANNSITRIIVDGKPATIHQLDDDDNPMDGQALNIDYKVDQDYAVLTGNAKVKQPVKGSAEGDKLTYNTKDSTMTGESSGGAPVHMTFQPKNPPPGAAPAKPATPAPTPKKP
ncbi:MULTISPECIES: lipopolysaccharide transport periplasmic protein LptA [unclassified Luteibacter]|uniref:lipopolysaccharide transport periplasmic protein LptA n=1 Tax=unclassified Luteibacter TaxID=2620188 RepID=UPI00056BEC67|nr:MULTISPECIES: lipopolysaccharide transport periplasmic protein LptA [unclassified Luteibacter]